MIRIALIFFCVLSLGEIHADGFKFDPDTQEVIGPNLRLPLTEVQQAEVAAQGHVTFSAGQLEWLRKF